MKSPSQKLGERLKQIRQQKEMSQGDIARALKVDRSYIGGIERGIRNPTLTTITKLARVLDVPADELLK